MFQDSFVSLSDPFNAGRSWYFLPIKENVPYTYKVICIAKHLWIFGCTHVQSSEATQRGDCGTCEALQGGG